MLVLRPETQRWLVRVAVLLLSLAVLAMAAPRFLASYRYLPVDIALERHFATHEIPTDRLAVLIRFASEAIAYHDHPRYHDGLSLLHYLRAVDVYTPALQRRDAYRAAEAAAVASLERAPVQPATWLRLAIVRWVLRDEPASIIEPWRMSIFTGRTAGSLLASRVELGLAFHGQLNDEATAMLRDQLLLAWRIQPGSLMAVIARRDPALAVTRRLIAGSDPVALAEMEAWNAR